MARTSIEPLIVGKVIGDVLDPFHPLVELTVHYGSRKISNGCEIKPSAALQKPFVQILRDAPPAPISSVLYTLVMVDPDAPSPSEPRLREWLHWVMVDIPEGSDATKGAGAGAVRGAAAADGDPQVRFRPFQAGEGADGSERGGGAAGNARELLHPPLRGP
ncbi:unnamed protein product [Linum tenue]|uniref:Uncharacterized protein n=1 Tax=Linum tenue TaxID=586396 RepID=A0AAV0PBZ9_9ROSI|nr:unnamed protein product [Linum tenue]